MKIILKKSDEIFIKKLYHSMLLITRKITLGPFFDRGIFLVDIIDSFEDNYKEKVLGRFETIVDRLEQIKMIDSLLDPAYNDDPVLAVAREYFLLKMPCPFLVDEFCSMYKHRPIACRDRIVSAVYGSV